MRIHVPELSVAPLLNIFSTSRFVVRCGASRPTPPRNMFAIKSRASGFALGGLALNAAGAAGALAVMSAATPAMLLSAASATLVAPAFVNYHFVHRTGVFDTRGMPPTRLQQSLRAVAWTASHLAMGAAVGLHCDILPVLTAGRLGAGLAVGVGIPLAVFFWNLWQLDAVARQQRPVTQVPGAAVNGQHRDMWFDQERKVPLAHLALLSWALPFFVRTPAIDAAVMMATSGAALCVLSVSSAARRAQQLAWQTDRIDPAAGSLLLSSAVMTSALWGLNIAAIRAQSLFSQLATPPTRIIGGRGVWRTAQRHA